MAAKDDKKSLQCWSKYLSFEVTFRISATKQLVSSTCYKQTNSSCSVLYWYKYTQVYVQVQVQFNKLDFLKNCFWIKQNGPYSEKRFLVGVVYSKNGVDWSIKMGKLTPLNKLSCYKISSFSSCYLKRWLQRKQNNNNNYENYDDWFRNEPTQTTMHGVVWIDITKYLFRAQSKWDGEWQVTWPHIRFWHYATLEIGCVKNRQMLTCAFNFRKIMLKLSSVDTTMNQMRIRRIF